MKNLEYAFLERHVKSNLNVFKVCVSIMMTNMYPHVQHRREEVVRRCSVKPVLPKISKNSEENTEVSFDKDAELQCDFLAKMFLQIF